MVQRGRFFDMFDKNEREHNNSGYVPHYRWFWKDEGGKLIISKGALNQILDATFLATRIMTGIDTDYIKRVNDLTEQVNILVGSSKSIPHTLLALLINRYCFENKDNTDAQKRLKLKYEYYDIPFVPDEITKSDKKCYTLGPNVIVYAQFAYFFFKGMYQPEGICPFQLPPKPPVDHLSSEWDPDEWFQSELKSKPIADAWFSSIATTLSRRSESP
jgi:hypothetical protein